MKEDSGPNQARIPSLWRHIYAVNSHGTMPSGEHQTRGFVKGWRLQKRLKLELPVSSFNYRVQIEHVFAF